jgi:hypothetical protein
MGHIQKLFSSLLTNGRKMLECLPRSDLSGLVFGGKAWSLPYGIRERCSTRVDCGLNHKHYTMLERLAKDKHSSLFGPFVSWEEKKFC